MPSTMTKKFTPEIDAQLYDEFVAVAERNGQTKRHVLEQALRFYLHNVVPSQHLVRREVMMPSSSRWLATVTCCSVSQNKKPNGGISYGGGSLPDAASINRDVRRSSW